MVSGVLSESIIGRAQAAGTISVECHNIRDYSTDKHRKTDDTPCGGGMGMVMTCQPIYDCYRHVRDRICYTDESVASGILEYPQYTKPRVFLGREVPQVLLSGDHKKIERYRLERAVELTRERRPDLLLLHPEYEQALLPKKKMSKRAHKDSTKRDDASVSAESRTACDADAQGGSEAE